MRRVRHVVPTADIVDVTVAVIIRSGSAVGLLLVDPEVAHAGELAAGNGVYIVEVHMVIETRVNHRDTDAGRIRAQRPRLRRIDVRIGVGIVPLQAFTLHKTAGRMQSVLRGIQRIIRGKRPLRLRCA